MSTKLALTSVATPIPTSTGTSSYSIASSPWTKEALFGLISILVAVLVPCIGMLVKDVLSKHRTTGWWKRGSSGGDVESGMPQQNTQHSGEDEDGTMVVLPVISLPLRSVIRQRSWDMWDEQLRLPWR